MKKERPRLALKSETVAVLTGAQLALVAAGAGVVDVSIIYWCPDNTSIVRSCSSCTGSGTA